MYKRSFFCDESCHTEHKFLGVGGICIENIDIPQFCEEIRAIKKKTQFKKLEWKRIRERPIKQDDPLKALMDLFYIKIKSNKLYYFLVIADSKKMHNNKPLYPLYKQLLLHRCCMIFPNAKIDIQIDRCNSDYSILQKSINKEAKEIFGQDAGQIHIHPHYQRKEKYVTEGEIQEMNDIVTGAILYSKNRKYLYDSGFRKSFLSKYLMQLFGLQHYNRNSPWQSAFNIWNFKDKNSDRGRKLVKPH